MTITPEQMIAWLDNEALSLFGPLSEIPEVREKEDRDAKTINAIRSHIRRTTDPKWKLVPVEPTVKMETKGDNITSHAFSKGHEADATLVYSAMISASPTPED